MKLFAAKGEGAAARLDPPHIHAGQSQRTMTLTAIACLLPAAAWGMAQYGYRAALVLAVAVASALVSEALAGFLRKRASFHDGTAVLTGLIIGMALPPGAPLVAPAIASAFAILVVKAPSGGLGGNWANPAMAGLAFAYASFREALSAYALPSAVRGADATSAATPLRAFAEAGFAHGAFAGTGFDSDGTKFLNELVFKRLGSPIAEGYVDLLFGNRPGAIGESCIVLLALGAVVLIAARVIRWEIPAAGILALAFLSWAFGGLASGASFFSGDPLLAVAGGSSFIALFFCATDPVTSPKSRLKCLAYGSFAGALIFLLRTAASGGDATAFAVLSANALSAAMERSPGKKAKREGR